MTATVFYVAKTEAGTIAVCWGEGKSIVFSLDNGGPWKSPIQPRRGDQIILEGLIPAGEGLWVPTTASPLPADPPKAMIRRTVEATAPKRCPRDGYQLNADGSCTACRIETL
jgi:hypothetical protein